LLAGYASTVTEGTDRIPELDLDLVRIRRFCAGRIPAHVAHLVRLEIDVEGRSVTRQTTVPRGRSSRGRREDNADLQLGASGMSGELPEASLAEQRVVAHGPVPEQASHQRRAATAGLVPWQLYAIELVNQRSVPVASVTSGKGTGTRSGARQADARIDMSPSTFRRILAITAPPSPKQAAGAERRGVIQPVVAHIEK
jgi:hypothetical protein